MIFLTGGTGFIGSYILEALVREGHAVRALRRNRDIPAYLSPEVAGKAEWVQGDILDVAALNEQLKGCDRIIHAAALVSFHPADKRALFKINTEGTANLVNTALENSIRDFIYISSVAALGKGNGHLPYNEEKQWESGNHQSHYAASKYHAEMEVWRGMGEGLTPLILNPSTVLGYGDWNRGSCAIFRSVYEGFPWYSKGSNGFVDVRDIAQALLGLMAAPVRNERYIVSAENWTYRDLFNRIADGFNRKHPARKATPLLATLAWRTEKIRSWFTGARPLLTRETASIAQRQSAYDNSKLLKALPGFQFRSLEDSVRDACDLYLRHMQQA
jgi:nucleoside-diphosphate-sugar epimerase